jgi:outer membrane protein TolC
MSRLLRATAPCVAGLLLSAGCNVKPLEPFDPRALQQRERQGVGDVQPLPKRPLPTTLESQFVSSRPGVPAPSTADLPPPATGPALGTEPVVRMPLQEIMQRAAASNLDVKVAGYGPAIESTRVVEAEARYDPTAFVNAQFERRDSKQAASFTSDANADIFTVQSGIRQNMYSGGQAELRLQNTRTEDRSDPSFFSPNPFYENQLVLQITQPILRDFGNTVNRARISISRNNERISLLDFRRQMEETAAEIEQTYWQLVGAERDEKINEELVARTFDTAKLLSARQGQDVTRVQLSQANSRLEARRALLISARARVRDLSDQLKRLMNDPSIPVTSPVLILPQTPAVEEPVRFDLEDQINTAMEFRLELGQQQLRVSSAEIASDVAKNNLLPQLNLIGSASIQGLDDSVESAFDDQFDFGNFGWAAGFQFEIPIGNRAARATYQRSILQRNQAIDQYRSLIDQISLDVKTAMRAVDSSWDRIAATRQARFAAADALRALQQKEEAGEALTPTFVQLKLDQQAELAEAALRESAAISDYNIALARLEQSKGTLLRYNNIIMEEDRGPMARR